MSPTPPKSEVPLSSLPTFFTQETCLRRGLCPITPLRHQGPSALYSHSIYYEQHGMPGSDPITGAKHKMVFIMGLNSSCFSWGPQVSYFGRRGEGGDCTALVFDNRGVGNSGYPRGPYTTSGMAEDVICLLDYLGWTGERELNVIGISLGGMIAQELAYRIPNRVCSLVLAVTTPGGFVLGNFPSWKGISSLFKLTFTSDPSKKVAIMLNLAFPEKWLLEKAESDPYAEQNGNTKGNKMGKTNYEVEKEILLRRSSIAKPQLILGHLSQMAAALTHHVSSDRLMFIAANIPKIAIVTGDEDHLVDPAGSERIKAAMDQAIRRGDEEDARRVEFLKFEGTGHAIHIQKGVQINELVERCAKEGRTMLDAGWKGCNV